MKKTNLNHALEAFLKSERLMTSERRSHLPANGLLTYQEMMTFHRDAELKQKEFYHLQKELHRLTPHLLEQMRPGKHDH